MGANSKIEWTHHTFNPWTGCTKVSAGCANCYAESWSKRSGVVKWGPGGTRRKTSASNWQQPLKWNREAEQAGERRRVFCASLADVFEDREELREWREELWDLISECSNLDWLLLTKRPENIGRMMGWFDEDMPSHVWLGTSVENQDAADMRIPHLLRAPAAVHFLSCEPLLGPVNLAKPYGKWHEELVQPGIDWVIVGGESGHGARLCDVKDVYAIVRQCHEANVACFVKQLGARPWIDRNHPECNQQLPSGATEADKVRFAEGLGEYLDHCYTFDLKDKKGGDWSEWPADLRVRQFPERVNA